MKYIELANKNGLTRDVAKLNNAAIEWNQSPAIVDALDRIKNDVSFHNVTNLCTETCRDVNYFDASYFAGHILMVSLCLNVVLLTVLAFVL